jgi:hypothetical protein
METIKKTKTFDCVKMKNDIQAKIYAETKNMSMEKLLDYFNEPIDKSLPVTHRNKE